MCVHSICTTTLWKKTSERGDTSRREKKDTFSCVSLADALFPPSCHHERANDLSTCIFRGPTIVFPPVVLDRWAPVHTHGRCDTSTLLTQHKYIQTQLLLFSDFDVVSCFVTINIRDKKKKIRGEEASAVCLFVKTTCGPSVLLFLNNYYIRIARRRERERDTHKLLNVTIGSLFVFLYTVCIHNEPTLYIYIYIYFFKGKKEGDVMRMKKRDNNSFFCVCVCVLRTRTGGGFIFG